MRPPLVLTWKAELRQAEGKQVAQLPYLDLGCHRKPLSAFQEGIFYCT